MAVRATVAIQMRPRLSKVDKAKAMLDTYGVIRPQMQAALDRLKDVPVDIEPSFPMAARSTQARKK